MKVLLVIIILIYSFPGFVVAWILLFICELMAKERIKIEGISFLEIGKLYAQKYKFVRPISETANAGFWIYIFYVWIKHLVGW